MPPVPVPSHPLDPLVLFVVFRVVDHAPEARHLVLQKALHSELECPLSAGSPVAGALQAHSGVLPIHRHQNDVAPIRL